ncbi:MAG: HAD-IA family hydrolase [Planctomycetota bacterium]|nr:HAD-IA family hydrolase [Planctomycetota bacterium]
MKVRAIFLDAGHTLVHPYPSVNAVYAAETSRMGVSIPEEDFAAVFPEVFRSFVREYSAQLQSSDEQDYQMWREITHRVYEKLPLDSISFDTWFDALYHRFGESEVWRCYEDVFPVLEDLRQKGFRLAIVSNWDTRLRKIAGGLGLVEKVDEIFISAEVGRRKPDPYIFEQALEKVGVHPEEAIHVGDLLEEDVVGAQRAGIGALLMARGKGVVPECDVPVIHSLGEIFSHLQTTS